MKIIKIDFETDTKAGYIASNFKEPEPISIIKPNSHVKAPLDPMQHPRCKNCDTLDIDPVFFNAFHLKVCKHCISEFEEIYALLTKTECKLDYLLTEPELKSLYHLEKVNPHRSHWFPMQLFVRCEVEEFAINKWGSLDKLDAEFVRRETAKQSNKEKKYKKKLDKLRTGVRTAEWKHKTEKAHEHRYVDDEGVSTCACGAELEYEEI